MDYSFYQHYWWLIISLLGAILVFMLFVQGGQSLVYELGKNEKHQKMLLASLSKKWELTFTTLVTFGGAFFASFPLFYSTSFGGAYWLWMLILFSFILQAVSYEFISKKGNVFGASTYRFFLFLNGLLGPVLLGVAVSTFFTGSYFIVNKDNIASTGMGMPIISSWQNPLHGLESLGNIWNMILGFAVFFLARCLGCLYFINNIDNEELRNRSRRQLIYNTYSFLALFVIYLIRLLTMNGYTENAQTGAISSEPFKYLHNLLEMPWIAALLLIGVILVIYGLLKSCITRDFIYGIWYTGIGTVMTVLSLFLTAGFNHTAYYPSLTDMQSSLTIANSSSSLFTLKVMSVVSLLIPFVLAYIFYAWRALDKKKIQISDIDEDGHY